MPPQIAAFVFVAGILGLFWLDRDDSIRPSKAVWLPIIWLSIASSRSVAAWLGMGPEKEIAGQPPPTSLTDQLVAFTLMLLGAMVLARRGRLVKSVLRVGWPIALYFSFCLVSVVWSDYSAWGLKRWFRALGDVIMVLIIATDVQPAAALRRLFSRVGFVLLPLSVLFIRYFPALGMAFDPFGEQQFTGVTTNKNVLGNVAFVMSLGAWWQILSLIRNKQEPHRTRRLIAQCTLLAFGIQVLITAHSATSGACFILGSGLMLAVTLPFARHRPAAVHTLVLAIVIGGVLMSLPGVRAAITGALGRKPDFTGRTEIWGILIPMAPNPIGGAGFETFWVGPRVRTLFQKIGGIQMTNESHNGYIEVYLNLGSLGVFFIVLILVQGYRRTVSVFRRDSSLGALLVAYVVTAVTFNITEAAFRMLHVEWFFLLLSIVVASRTTGIAKARSVSTRETVGFTGHRIASSRWVQPV